jgi:Holliday junction DNA helicase RuvA
VGYTVTTTPDAFKVGEPLELHIHTHVREDALDLYGFRTAAEKQLFLMLLSVSGIGPKGAMAVLSGGSIDSLLDAIENGDVAYLCRAPGVGKKTGERIVLELGDSIRKKRALGLFGSASSAAASRASGATASPTGTSARRTVVFREAMTALVGLGYRSVEVEDLLTRIFEESAEMPHKVEDLLKTALRQLA